MSTVDFSGLVWRKSSRSGTHTNDNCVEVAYSVRSIAVRDSKNPAAGQLAVPERGWHTFLDGVRNLGSGPGVS